MKSPSLLPVLQSTPVGVLAASSALQVATALSKDFKEKTPGNNVIPIFPNIETYQVTKNSAFPDYLQNIACNPWPTLGKA